MLYSALLSCQKLLRKFTQIKLMYSRIFNSSETTFRRGPPVTSLTQSERTGKASGLTDGSGQTEPEGRAGQETKDVMIGKS